MAYSFVVFVAAPLIAVTGLAMSPAVTAALPFLLTLFGGYQSARTIHFFTFVALLLFVGIHVVMIVKSGFRRQLRHDRRRMIMKTNGLITRRRAIVTGLAAVGGFSSRDRRRISRQPTGTCAWATR